MDTTVMDMVMDMDMDITMDTMDMDTIMDMDTTGMVTMDTSMDKSYRVEDTVGIQDCKFFLVT